MLIVDGLKQVQEYNNVEEAQNEVLLI